MQLEISGGGMSNEKISFDDLIIGVGERKFFPLYPVKLCGLHSIYFKVRVRAVGFD